MEKNKSPIAIVGMACRFPDASTLEHYWQNVLNGHVSFKSLPENRWDHSFFHAEHSRVNDKTYVKKGAFIDDGSVENFPAMYFGVPPRRVTAMDPQHRLLLEVVDQALKDAGLERPELGLDIAHTGTYIGLSTNEFRNTLSVRNTALLMASGAFGETLNPEETEVLQKAVAKTDPISAFSIAGSLLNMAAANIAARWNFQGPAYTVDAACASALVAVHDAVTALRAGLCNAAIAGGAYLNLSPENLVGFARIGAVSRQGACRPFDENADGFLQGDGVGIVVLKRLDEALQNHDRVYAVICGGGGTNDGKGGGPMAPSKDGQYNAIRRAYLDAGVSFDNTGYNECHGTGTAAGDPVEIAALRSAVEDLSTHEVTPGSIHLGSVKANIGHTMSAAGVAGLIKAALVLEHKIIPPQTGLDKPAKHLDIENSPFRFANTQKPYPKPENGPRRAGVSSFGFGGTNSHMLLEEAGEAQTHEGMLRSNELVVLSAETKEHLAAHALELMHTLKSINAQTSPAPSLAQIAYTLSATRKPLAERLTIVASDIQELIAHLETAATKLHTIVAEKSTVEHAQLSSDIFITPDKFLGCPARIAFMFPGQGAQRVGLLHSFYTQFPVFRNQLDAYAESIAPLLKKPLLSYLYPENLEVLADNEPERLEAEAELRATEICQPAMAALGLSVAALLEDFGVHADVTLGHSLGEFAAAAWGHLIAPKAALPFVAERGRIMARMHLEDPGAMAAIRADANEVAEHIQGRQGVWLANMNSPKQTVISGFTEAVHQTVDHLIKRGLVAKVLPVSHAFHSPVLQDVGAKIENLVDALPYGTQRDDRHEDTPPRVVSAIAFDAHAYNLDAPEKTKTVFKKHATAPVNFLQALKNCRETNAPVDVFLEMGAGKTLTAFVRATFGPHGTAAAAAVAWDTREDGTQLHRTLGQLVALGHDLRLDKLFNERLTPISLPTPPLQRERYWPVRHERKGFSLSGAARSHPQEKTMPISDNKAKADPALIALFREQNAILKQHADIMAKQAAALGEAVSYAPAETRNDITKAETEDPTPGSTDNRHIVPATAAPQPTLKADGNAKIEPEPSRPDVTQVSAIILKAVSQVSAFPLANLKIEQLLAGDLGFDSLMLVDLVSDIQKNFPSLDGIPQSLLGPNTSIADIIDYVENNIGTAARGITTIAEAEKHPQQNRPLERYTPVLKRRARSLLPGTRAGHASAHTGFLVVNMGRNTQLSQAIVEHLKKRNLKPIHIHLDREHADTKPTAIDKADLMATWSGSATGFVHILEQLEVHNIAPSNLLFIDSSTTPPLTELLSTQDSAEEFDAAEYLSTVHTATQNLARVIKDQLGIVGFISTSGGDFGSAGTVATQLPQVGLAAYAKSLAREWPEVHIKAIDLDENMNADNSADHVLDELYAAERDVEIGFPRGERHVVVLDRAPFSTDSTPQVPNKTDVWLISGGARGIGLVLAEDLAKTGCGLVVIGSRSIDDTQVQAGMERLKQAGGRVHYIQWNLGLDPIPHEAIQTAERKLGKCTGIIHGAGVLKDGRIEKKTAGDFAAVLGVKVKGLLKLLTAIPSAQLKTVVAYSSWSARFGNIGQTDYAAANELVNKLLVSFARQEAQHAKVVSIAWPPWEDSSMSGSIPSIVKNAMLAEGVPFVSNAHGIQALHQELSTSDNAVEVLYGVDQPSEVSAFLGAVSLSTQTHPYLNDHRLKGTPVMPFASALDYVSAVSETVTHERTPFVVRDLTLFNGVEVDTPVELSVKMHHRAWQNGRSPELELELHTKSHGDAKSKVAYRATAAAGPTALRGDEEGGTHLAIPNNGRVPEVDLAAFYAQLHIHGPMLQGILSVDDMGPTHVIGVVKTSKPVDWIPNAERSNWQSDPLVIDSSFQLVAYWLWKEHAKIAFPVSFESYVQHRRFGNEKVRCVVVRDTQNSGDNADTFVGSIEYLDTRGSQIAIMHKVKARLLDAEKPQDTMAAAEVALSNDGPDIAQEHYNISAFEEVVALNQRIEAAAIMGIKNPFFGVHEGVARETSIVDGQKMVNFSSYNYLGLSGHESVSQAAKAAIDRYGTSVSASRVASGQKPVHKELETSIARFVGTEDSVVFSAGHMTNETTIGHLLGPDDLIIHDSLAHNSILTGAALSGAKRRPFPHNDWKALDKILGSLRGNYKKVMIAIEGVYSMDGDLPDLPAFVKIKKKHKCLLFVDEAHSIGVVGQGGHGIGALFNINRSEVDLWMGTLSKAFASCGGYIAGSADLCQYLRYTAPAFVFSAGISPANAAAAVASIKEIEANPQWADTLLNNARHFLQECHKHGLDTGFSKGSAVVPVIVGNSLHCLKLSEQLGKRGVNVQPIVYPAVDDDAARLRFFLSSTHSHQQLEETALIVAEELNRIRAGEGDMLTL